METTLRLLVVEDSVADAELAVRHLKSAGIACTWKRVQSAAELRAALVEFEPELILSDFSLPGFDGLAALEIAMETAPEIPFIFVSGTIGEERAIEALKRGATDYVLKTNLTRLVAAVRRALAEAATRRARREAEERVQRLTRVLQMLSGINTAVIRIRDREELFREACRLAHRVGGYALAFVSLVDPGTRTARPVAWAGDGAERLQELSFHVAETAAGDLSVTGRVLRTGEPVIVDDLGPPGSGPRRFNERLHPDLRSIASLPLRVDDTPLGALTLGSVAAAAVGDDERRLLEEVAANLSFALQYLDRQDTVRFLSYFDPLTAMAKRALLCERLARSLSRLASVDPGPTVVVLDIEHLSFINDSLGRHNGDLLLQKVADRLKRHFGESELVAHLGGGTFAFPLSHGGSEEDALRALQDHLTSLFSAPFQLGGRDLPVSVKCGLARFPQNGADANDLVQNAEAALRMAKASGEKYLHHRLEMNSEVARRLTMEHKLRTAIVEKQFVLHYQPKVHIATGRVQGVEALLRWQHPEQGLLAPGAFLSILESTGLIVPVGNWVLEQAVADCRRWERLGLPPLRIAVNISPAQLRRQAFAEDILGTAMRWSSPAWGLDIEITEGALLDDPSWVLQKLQALRAGGIRIAIDDFGTGYSSLSRLSQLPIDTLKIDPTFTQLLPEDQGARTLVTTIIGLARAFGLTTVAEGVEQPEQLEFLEGAGCDHSQGYIHSRPVPSPELELLVTQNGGRLIPTASEQRPAAAVRRRKRARRS